METKHTRVTRDDWIQAAVNAMRTDGIGGMKISVLAASLDVARSSFYWHFAGRTDLEAGVLDVWIARNTTPIVERAARPAPTVTAAIYGLFECWADPTLFDHLLEFAVRDWARRDDAVHTRLVESDSARIEAIAALHRRYGDDETKALVRARVHFHSQIGMYALAIDEPIAERLRLVPAYVEAFTGALPSNAETVTFVDWVINVTMRP